MTKNYVRAYPNYKQQALNRITNVLMGILRETDFFRRFPRTFGYLDKFFLSYDKLYFEEEFQLANGGMVEGFQVLFWGRRCFRLRGKEIIYSTSLSYQRRKLTEEEYNIIYHNLGILHKFAGSSYSTIQMKIGPIQRYAIDYNMMKFEGKWGNTYEEKRSLAR
jgi:hypothetical protein